MSSSFSSSKESLLLRTILSDCCFMIRENFCLIILAINNRLDYGAIISGILIFDIVFNGKFEMIALTML